MKEEARKIDPFSATAECFGKIGPREHMGYHLLIRPTQDEKWKKDGEALVGKLIGKKAAPKKGKLAEALGPLAEGWGEPLQGLLGAGGAETPVRKKEETREGSLMQHISPGTKDIVAAIERNILKPGFETIIRFCYVAPRDVFSMSHVSSFIGSTKQYNTQTLNALKMNTKAMATKVGWWLPSYWKKKKKAYKKTLFYRYYRARKPFTDTWSLVSRRIVLNTEELATIYHYPGTTAKAPMMPRIEARRSEPPATLPVG